MAISKERKSELVKQFGKNEKDTGATEVQIAILTEEINNLTGTAILCFIRKLLMKFLMKNLMSLSLM